MGCLLIVSKDLSLSCLRVAFDKSTLPFIVSPRRGGGINKFGEKQGRNKHINQEIIEIIVSFSQKECKEIQFFTCFQENYIAVACFYSKIVPEYAHREFSINFKMGCCLCWYFISGLVAYIAHSQPGKLLARCLNFGQNLRLGPKQLGCL